MNDMNLSRTRPGESSTPHLVIEDLDAVSDQAGVLFTVCVRTVPTGTAAAAVPDTGRLGA